MLLYKFACVQASMQSNIHVATSDQIWNTGNAIAALLIQTEPMPHWRLDMMGMLGMRRKNNIKTNKTQQVV